MTIAVGLLANSGVVLAADTQVTIQNYWKGASGKFMATGIRRREQPSGACVVTGATGLFEFLHSLGDEVWKDFAESLDEADKAAAFQRFQNIVHQFYGKHVAGDPDRLQTDILIGYQREGELALWQSARSTLVEQYQYGAVGIGSAAALSWLGKVYDGPRDIPASVVLATFATAVAKDSVDGCGKYTNVFVVEADGYRRLNQSIINEIDRLYESLADDVQPNLVRECLGPERASSPRISLEELKQQTADVIERIRGTTPDWVTQWRARRWRRLAGKDDQGTSTEVVLDPPPLQD